MAIAQHSVDRDFERLDAIIAAEERALLQRQPNSAAMARKASSSLAGGVTSNWQIARPQPIWLSHGSGSQGPQVGVEVWVWLPLEDVGPPDRRASAPASGGIPKEIRDLTLIVPFNALGVLRRTFAEHRGEIAGMILEPVMMNAGIIPPL